MEFRAEFFPKAFAQKIEHHHKLLLIGSCFTEQIGNKLINSKFKVLQNPNGILFNPVSISQALNSYASAGQYTEEDLFYHNELWGSWHHHTRFSGTDKQRVLNNINFSRCEAADFVKTTDWLLITLGSAFVYENIPGNISSFEGVVANCHKVPTDKFRKRLLDPTEISKNLQAAIESVRSVNNQVRIIFTISPVRHLREGFIENNRSKAALIQAVHSLTNATDIFYFPAYELVIDDLRDYRFFAEDLVHPNYSATNYVWEKFIAACIDERSQEIMKEIAVINAAVNHKPFNPQSEQHKKFQQVHLQKITALMQKHHYLKFEEEIRHLGSA